MLEVGPLDGRRQRKRCRQCLSSHLRCSGTFPCEHCTRQKKKCQPPRQPSSLIAIRAGTIDLSSSPRQSSPTGNTQSTYSRSTVYKAPSLDKEAIYALGFFEDFLQRNNFTGRSSPYTLDIAGRIASHRSLHQSALAIGALQTSYSDRSARQKHTAQALYSYRSAVSALRLEICGPRTQDLISISWSTFLLGLFELMYDDTGQGWLRHLLFGTSQILQSLSPHRCRQGSGMRFLLETRPSEIARAMLFGGPTFLATEQWMGLTRSMWTGENVRYWSPKERLLDIMTSCADLSYRTNLAIRSKQDADLYTLTSLAEQGIELRSALHDWEVAANVWKPPTPNDQQMTVAWLFYAAISIYLSGIYDYSHIWADSGILIPTLSVSIIDDHVLSILDITSLAIETKPLAGVLFLFPLRVAGARAYKFEQRLRIKGLLLKIAASFRAANAFFSDLEDLWADPDSYHNQG